MMDPMPRYVRPHLESHVEATIEALGNRVRVAIIGSLLQEGPATRGQLAQRIEVNQQTVLRHLRPLVEHGLVTADPPIGEHVSGQRVAYSADAKEIQRCHDILGTALGIM